MASEQLAVLFADVCDSTTIYEAIGDARALGLISRLFDVLTEKVERARRQDREDARRRHGVPVPGRRRGVPVPRATCRQPRSPPRRATAPKLTIKVAFNWGPVVTEHGDVFGDTVNVCARLVSLAGPHQVLTTQETVDALSPSLRSPLPPALSAAGARPRRGGARVRGAVAVRRSRRAPRAFALLCSRAAARVDGSSSLPTAATRS